MPVAKALVNLQVKTSPETLNTFEEQFAASECTTKGQFIEAILEAYLNPPKGKNIEVSKPEDTAAIQNLTNEIGRLKIERDFLKDENARLESMYTDTNRTALVLQEEVRTLQAAPVIGENDVLVQLSPLFKLVLKLEAAILKKKTGKDYTTQDILIEAYKEIGITGGRNVPFRQWSAADYKKVESALSTPAAQ